MDKFNGMEEGWYIWYQLMGRLRARIDDTGVLCKDVCFSQQRGEGQRGSASLSCPFLFSCLQSTYLFLIILLFSTHPQPQTTPTSL